MKILLVISIILLQGCTATQNFLCWYQYTDNFMKKERYEEHCAKEEETQAHWEKYALEFEEALNEEEQLPW